MVQPRPMPCVTSPFRKLSMAGTSIGWRRLRTSNMARGDDIRTLRKEQTMPHVIVKLWPGKSEQQKQKLADKITQATRAMLHYREESVSAGLAMADIDGAGLHLRLVGDAAVWHRP